jgi:uncharacterized protein with von Willebrand factor type A (vWA) domain
LTEGDEDMCSLLRKKRFPAMPVHLGRALANVKAGAARMQGRSRIRPRSDMPQMVAPEREWELLREVEDAARRYRRAQQELAHREELGGEVAEFRLLLDAVALSHHQLDRALLEIQRYYETAGVAGDRSGS